MSCHSGVGPTIDDNTSPLIPLAVGNYWVYQEYSLNKDGSIRSATEDLGGFKIIDTLSVSLNGQRLKAFQYSRYDSSTNWSSPEGKLIYYGNDGVHFAGTTEKDSINLLFNDLMFKYPTNKGEKTLAHTFYYFLFGNLENIPDSVITTYTCVSTDSLFSTPVGDFRCIVYKLRLMLDDYFYLGDAYYFFKPDLGLVGLIRVIYSYITDKHYYSTKDVLVNYRLK